MKITWHGHSAFSLEADGKTVIIDPFLSNNPVSSTNPDDVNPSTILITHAHNDHVGDTMEIAKRTGAKVITVVELADWLESQGLENVVGANHGGTVEFDGGIVTFTPAWHSSSYTLEDGSTVANGIPAGLVIRFGGKSIYHAGDTALFSDMQLIGDQDLDVAILPIGDHFTMGPRDAVRAAEWLNAGIVIPCHYNTFPLLTQDGDAFKSEVESRTSSTVELLKVGARTDIS